MLSVLHALLLSYPQRLALNFNYFVEDDTVIVDERAQEQRYEKYFMAQVRIDIIITVTWHLIT